MAAAETMMCLTVLAQQLGQSCCRQQRSLTCVVSKTLDFLQAAESTFSLWGFLQHKTCGKNHVGSTALVCYNQVADCPCVTCNCNKDSKIEAAAVLEYLVSCCNRLPVADRFNCPITAAAGVFDPAVNKLRSSMMQQVKAFKELQQQQQAGKAAPSASTTAAVTGKVSWQSCKQLYSRSLVKDSG
jgi:hypothetical protein